MVVTTTCVLTLEGDGGDNYLCVDTGGWWW